MIQELFLANKDFKIGYREKSIKDLWDIQNTFFLSSSYN